jgi:hypothetical protein
LQGSENHCAKTCPSSPEAATTAKNHSGIHDGDAPSHWKSHAAGITTNMWLR